MKKKICVYTCITGDYDEVKEFEKFKEDNIDYYLFTNNKNIKSNFWNVIYIQNNNLDNICLSRKIKILGHDIINKNYDISIYIDGTIKLKNKITSFLNKYCDLDTYNFIGFKHRFNDCIYDEAKACVKYKKENKEIILKQIEFLRQENYPEHNGLIEASILIRNVKSKDVKQTCKLWFDIFLKYSKRDQLSFNYAAYKTNLNFKLLDINVCDNEYFISEVHAIAKTIDKYRIYFGDDTSLDTFDYNLDFCDFYTKDKNNNYLIKIKCPIDSESFKLELSKAGNIYVNKIILNNVELEKKNYESINGFEIDNKLSFFCYDPSIIIKGNFKKNENIKIVIDMNFYSEIEMFKVINTLNHEYTLCKNDLLNEQNHSYNLEEANKNLKEELNVILNSKSYKVTKSLRNIFNFIRRK